MHGFADHSGRYHSLFRSLNAAGITCHTADLTGHGTSPQPPGYLSNFSEYLDDVGEILAAAHADRDDLPLFLMGHSMGGLIAATHIIERQPTIAGLLMSNPAIAFAVRVPSWKSLLGTVMSTIWPSFKVPAGLELEALSRDPEVVAAARRDPLRFHFATARWYTQCMAAQKHLAMSAAKITVPCLTMLAGKDRLVDPAATRAWHGKLGGNASLHEYPQCYHELFNEPEKADVIDDLIAFIESFCD